MVTKTETVSPAHLLSQERQREWGETEIAWPPERELPEITRPLPAGTRVISADSHWLEPDRFVDLMPARYRDRAPRGRFTERGYHFEIDGESTDNPALPSTMVEGRAGMWDPQIRAEEITREGVEQEILFPQRMLGIIRHKDFDYIQACMDAYNQLIADFCAQQPGRFHGLALLNYWNPEATRDELAKIQAMGFKGVLMPSLPPPHARTYYNARALEPMWAAIAESGLPLSFHVGETFDARGQGGLATTIVVAFEPFRRLFALLAFAGIFERNPGLQVVFTEGGIAWVPSALFDSDRVYASFESEMTPKLANPPSYYWHQNCYATFIEDPSGLRQLDLIGHDRVLWGSDYPHPESTVGYTQRTLWDIIDACETVEQAQAIIGGNAARVWNLD